MDEGLLLDPCLIVGGDLNFTISAKEFWGHGSRLDPLILFSHIGRVEDYRCGATENSSDFKEMEGR